jgi:DNA-binding IclR family transcriptional regulator
MSATQKTPEMKDAFQVLQNLAIGGGEERRFLARLRGKDEQTIALSLRERNTKLYSHSALAELLGVSKATAHRRAKGVMSDG